MGSHTRDTWGATRSAITMMVAGLVLVLVLAITATTTRASSEPRSLTDAQLAARAATLQRTATAIGERLLADAAERDRIEQERDLAQSLLDDYLADTYRHAVVDGDLTQQVLESGSIRGASERMQMASIVASYHDSVLRSLQQTQTRLDVTDAQHAELVAQLTAVQDELVPITAEQSRRAAIHAKYEADRRARAEVRAAHRAAASSAGALVSDAAIPVGAQPSAQMIDAYLASKGSPMAGQGAAFVASGMRWRIDPRLLVAIAGAESSFGQVTCGPNNAWGWSCPSSPADFGSWADGIDTVAQGLRSYYLDEGRTSVVLIQQKYCPVGVANDPNGLNSHWTSNVTRFLLELGGNPSMVGPGPSGPAAIGLPSFGVFGSGD